MFCQRCGKENKNSAKYCLFCGNEFSKSDRAAAKQKTLPFRQLLSQQPIDSAASPTTHEIDSYVSELETWILDMYDYCERQGNAISKLSESNKALKDRHGEAAKKLKDYALAFQSLKTEYDKLVADKKKTDYEQANELASLKNKLLTRSRQVEINEAANESRRLERSNHIEQLSLKNSKLLKRIKELERAMANEMDENSKLKKQIIKLESELGRISQAPQSSNEIIHHKHYDNMSGHEFEQFCAGLLRNNGYSDVEVTSGSGDYGVDILASKGGITYAIQCKCYSSNIGNKAVQEIYSGKDFYKRHIGIILTNQYFTPSAKETAERTGIVLWDREQLEKMIK